MKTRLASLLAIVLVLTMAFGFASCDTKPAKDDPTEAVTTTAADTEAVNATEAPSETEAATETEPETTEAATTEAVTTEAATTKAAETTTAKADAKPSDPDYNPVGKSKAQIVEYYNARVNYVREKKPAFTRTTVMRIDKISFSNKLINAVATPIIEKKMSGKPEVDSFNKGANNANEFMGPLAKSNLSASNVASATARKEGAGYVVTLNLGNEINPAKGGNSTYSKAFAISTRQDLLDDLKGDGLTGSVDDTTMTYHSGFASINVNDKGEITKASGNFKVDVISNGAKVKGIKSDVDAKQVTTNEYSGFAY